MPRQARIGFSQIGIHPRRPLDKCTCGRFREVTGASAFAKQNMCSGEVTRLLSEMLTLKTLCQGDCLRCERPRALRPIAEPVAAVVNDVCGGREEDESPAGETRVAENADQGMKIWNQRGHLDRTWQVLEAVRKVADGHGVSMAQVSIAWLAARPAVASVILGARNMEQLADNLAAADVRLSPEETQLLDVTSDPGAPDYPYGEPGQTQRSRRIEGGRF